MKEFHRGDYDNIQTDLLKRFLRLPGIQEIVLDDVKDYLSVLEHGQSGTNEYRLGKQGQTSALSSNSSLRKNGGSSSSSSNLSGKSGQNASSSSETSSNSTDSEEEQKMFEFKRRSTPGGPSGSRSGGGGASLGEKSTIGKGTKRNRRGSSFEAGTPPINVSTSQQTSVELSSPLYDPMEADGHGTYVERPAVCSHSSILVCSNFVVLANKRSTTV